MTFELWAAFREEWTIRPPVHWLVARFIGYEPPEAKQYMDADAFKAFIEASGGALAGVTRR